jgi:cytoskeletal protein CcmA (bactofilin family)
MRNCEVTFLHEVRAKEMIVHGDVSGDFLVEGPFILHPGATLTGTITARAIKIHDGGQVRGQFRVLDGVTEGMTQMTAKWFWRCLNNSGKDQCRSVMFEPHA